ncbi:MAG: hypothetical protein Fur0041_17790 [Bacteroidia bacterium]
MSEVIIYGSYLSGLDDAITNNTQTDFFATFDYTDIFEVEYFNDIEIGLENGSLLFNKYVNNDAIWYIVVPASYSGASIEDIIDSHEMAIPVKVI